MPIPRKITGMANIRLAPLTMAKNIPRVVLESTTHL